MDGANIYSDIVDGASISSDITEGVAINSDVVQSAEITGEIAVGGKGDKGDGAAVSIGGNTAGTPEIISSGTMQFQGGSNITISQNGQTLVFSGGGGGITPAISGSNGSFTFSTVSFGNLNGISFYTSNGSMVGSYTVPNDYALSNHSHGNPTLALTNISGTTASNSAGLTLSLSAAAGGGGADGYNILAAGTQTANTTGTILFSNGNGITFGMSNSSRITASHNGITQQSTQPVAISGSNGSFIFSTVTFGNLNGISFYTSNGSVVGSYTVPTQSVQTQNMVSINGSTGAISLATGSSLSSSSNGSTITFGLASNITTALQSAGAYLTTAMQSNTPIVQSINGSSGTFSLNTGSSLSSSRVGNAITFGLASNITTALQSAGAYLTTARASNDAVGLNTAATNVTWTVNSGGISLNAGAYLTTAMASNRGTDFVQANAAFAGTNASGTIASNGISVSVNAGGGATPVASASNGSFSFTTLGFSNANNVTFGTSAGSIITASVAAPGAAAENNWVNLLGANTAGNTTASGSTIGVSGINLTLSGTNGSVYNISAPATSSLSATGQVSISTNGSTISIGVPSAITYSRYDEFRESPKVAGEIGNASLHIQPWLMPNVQFDRVVLHKAFSNASNSSNSFTVSDWVGIYTLNVSTLSLLASTSISTNFTGSGTAGSYLSYGGGIKAHTIGFTNTLTEGHYWIGVIQRTTTGGGAGHTLNQVLNSQMNSTYRGLMGAATNATNQMSTGFGVYSATTSAMPGSVAISEVRGNSSVFLRPPSIYFVSGTI